MHTLSQTGLVLNVFLNARAAARAVGVDASEIAAALGAARPVVGGYRWRRHRIIDQLPGEVWKKIPDLPFGAKHLASTKGRIKSATGQVLSLTRRPNGYMSIRICVGNRGRGFLVHRLVARTFLQQPTVPDGVRMVVDHLNNRRNDNRVSNLRWVSQRENTTRACSRAVIQIGLDGKIMRKFPSAAEAARVIGVEASSIFQSINRGRMCDRSRWQYVDPMTDDELTAYFDFITLARKNRRTKTAATWAFESRFTDRPPEQQHRHPNVWHNETGGSHSRSCALSDQSGDKQSRMVRGL